MELNINIRFPGQDATLKGLADLVRESIGLLKVEIAQGKVIMSALEDLTREVEEAKTVQASAVALITGMATQLTELAQNATDLEQFKQDVTGLANELSASTDATAAAISANTPATPTDPVDPAQPQT